MHVSASLKIPSASASTTASVETTGSVRSQELHRASRTRRLRRSEKRLYATGCPAQVRIGSIAPIEDRYALSRSCAAFPPTRSRSLAGGHQRGQGDEGPWRVTQGHCGGSPGQGPQDLPRGGEPGAEGCLLKLIWTRG